MAGPPPTPRSKLDVLYREVLGEMAPLISRIEAAIEAADALMERSREMPNNLRQMLTETSQQHTEDATRKLARSARELEAATRALNVAAVATTQAARRHVWLTIILALAAGFLGGALAGIALGGLLLPP